MNNISLFFQIFNLQGQFPIIDNIMVFGTTFLIYLIILLVLVMGFIGRVREKKAFLLIILGLPLAVLLIKGIHLFFYESRPFVTFHFTPLIKEAANASFPSRHATV